MGRRLGRGFALADMMLAVAVMGLVMMAVIPMLNRNSNDANAKSISDDLANFKAAAQAHFTANRSAYDAAMADGTGASTLCKVGVAADGSGGTVANSTTLHTCAIDGSMLTYLKAMPTTVKATNAYGEQWVAIYRQIYNAGVATGSDEAMFVSAAITTGGGAVAANDRRYRIATVAASTLGGSGGAVPDTDRQLCVATRSNSTYQVCGDGWKVNLSDFISSTQLTAFGARLPN